MQVTPTAWRRSGIRIASRQGFRDAEKARGNLERIEAYLKKDEAGSFESEYSDETILGILSAWQLDADGNLVETNAKK